MKFLKVLIGIIPILLLLFLTLICDVIIWVSIKADEFGYGLEELVEKIVKWTED